MLKDINKLAKSYIPTYYTATLVTYMHYLYTRVRVIRSLPGIKKFIINHSVAQLKRYCNECGERLCQKCAKRRNKIVVKVTAEKFRKKLNEFETAGELGHDYECLWIVTTLY